MSHVTITRVFEIDYGHRLLKHPGKCVNYHGHRGRFEVTVRAPVGADGMVVDFGVIKHALGNWLDAYWDHAMILQAGDELYERMRDMGMKVYLLEAPPTVENLVQHFALDIARGLLRHADEALVLEHVRLYETPNCWADWTRATTKSTPTFLSMATYE